MRRNVTLSATSGVIVQVVRPMVTLVTLPILSRYLDDTELGVWFIALSLIGIVNFVSGGLSATVITHIGRASKNLDVDKITEIASSALIISTACAAALVMSLLPLVWWLDWNWVLNLQGGLDDKEVNRLMATIIVCIAFSFVAIIPRQVIFGRLHGFLAHSLEIVGTVIAGGILIFATVNQMPMWVMGAIFAGMPSAILFVGGIAYMRYERIKLFSKNQINTETFNLIKADVFKMSGYQIAYSVSSQTDILMIGIFLGAPAAGVFGIAQRAFSLITMALLAINQAQWPAFARLDAEGDQYRLAQLFRRTLITVPTIGMFAAVLLLINFEYLVELWLGPTAETTKSLLYGFVFWVLVCSATNVCDILLRAKNETTRLLKNMSFMAFLNVGLTIALLPTIGEAGAIWGSVIAYMIALLIPHLIFLRPYIFGSAK